MMGEMNGVTKSGTLAWWQVFVPFYNYYVLWIVDRPPRWRRPSRWSACSSLPRGIVVYFFFWLYALAADLNDIAKALPPG